MEFQPNESKNRRNIAKHGVDFNYASLIFLGSVLEVKDDRNDYGEERFIAIGYIGTGCYVVAFTRRDGAIRLISARRGGRRDRQRYQAYLAGGT
jgi:hypothetical protein